MNDDEPESLSDLLAELPTATPLFLPDELLAIWFPPWAEAGLLDGDSLDAARRYGERFGCTFTHDANMDQWCYTKPPTRN